MKENKTVGPSVAKREIDPWSPGVSEERWILFSHQMALFSTECCWGGVGKGAANFQLHYVKIEKPYMSS